MTDEENITYLGDAVYAEYDGLGIWLRTGHHRVEYCDDKVYLEHDVMKKLNAFYESHIRENDK